MTCTGAATVPVAVAGGPVILDVETGYSTNGKYSAEMRLPSGWQTIGKGNVADHIQDRHVLPADPAALIASVTRLLIVANYAPAFSPTGRQIKVEYVFTQDGQQLHREPIERADAEILQCDHTFSFKAA